MKYKTSVKDADFVFHTGQQIHHPHLHPVHSVVSHCCLLSVLHKMYQQHVNCEQQAYHDTNCVKLSRSQPASETQMKRHAVRH